MGELAMKPDSRWNLSCAAVTVVRSGRPVLSGIDLNLRADECVCLVGPNGAGKTTLMLTMLGLLPPSRGTVLVNLEPIQRLSARSRARLAAYVPQHLEYLPTFRVGEVVAGGRFPHTGFLGRFSDVDRAAVRGALERCGLTRLAERRLDTVSGGERRKTLLAAAIAQDPQMLFLDEPNTALDPAYQIELVRILRQWIAGGRGLLVVSHDLQLPAALGGRVIALRAGRIVADGQCDRLLNPTTLENLYGARFEVLSTPQHDVRLVLPSWWTSG